MHFFKHILLKFIFLLIFAGDVINPHDEVLITKLLQKVVKFPNKHHLSGYIEYETDVPNMRSEFKLGMIDIPSKKITFNLRII